VSPSQPAPLVDSNLLVRYLTGTPPEMAEQAARLIDTDEPLLLSELVLVETAYVLSSFYGMERADITEALMGLVQRQNFRSVSLPKSLLLEALSLCRGSKRYSFTDAFLWAQARHLGTRIYSFDQRFPSGGVEIIGLTPE
jgi:predicted nucleic acid-binding protein